MNIGSVSSSNYSFLSGVQAPSSVSGTQDADGDSGTATAVHGGGHHHGGGRVGQAVMDALQSLGVSLPPPPGAQTQSDSTTTGTSSATSAVGSTDASSSTGTVRTDLRAFMHDLFQAVKGEQTSGSGTTGSDPSKPGASFASGLSALISQVSSGAAPADLQSAFNQLTTDLQSATGGSSGSSGSLSSGDGSQPNLLSFLTKLQDSLGYAASNNSATGNLVSATA
jgi:hypothetical protein